MSSERPPPPAPSLQPPDDLPNTPSGVWKLVDGKLVSVTEQLRAEAQADADWVSAVVGQAKRGGYALAAIVVTALGVLFGAWRALAADTQHQIDAGLSLMEQKHGALVEETRRNTDYLNRRLDRIEKLVEYRVPEAARPPPVPPPPPAADAGVRR